MQRLTTAETKDAKDFKPQEFEDNFKEYLQKSFALTDTTIGNHTSTFLNHLYRGIVFKYNDDIFDSNITKDKAEEVILDMEELFNRKKDELNKFSDNDSRKTALIIFKDIGDKIKKYKEQTFPGVNIIKKIPQKNLETPIFPYRLYLDQKNIISDQKLNEAFNKSLLTIASLNFKKRFDTILICDSFSEHHLPWGGEFIKHLCETINLFSNKKAFSARSLSLNEIDKMDEASHAFVLGVNDSEKEMDNHAKAQMNKLQISNKIKLSNMLSILLNSDRDSAIPSVSYSAPIAYWGIYSYFIFICELISYLHQDLHVEKVKEIFLNQQEIQRNSTMLLKGLTHEQVKYQLSTGNKSENKEIKIEEKVAVTSDVVMKDSASQASSTTSSLSTSSVKMSDLNISESKDLKDQTTPSTTTLTTASVIMSDINKSESKDLKDVKPSEFNLDFKSLHNTKNRISNSNTQNFINTLLQTVEQTINEILSNAKTVRMTQEETHKAFLLILNNLKIASENIKKSGSDVTSRQRANDIINKMIEVISKYIQNNFKVIESKFETKSDVINGYQLYVEQRILFRPDIVDDFKKLLTTIRNEALTKYRYNMIPTFLICDPENKKSPWIDSFIKQFFEIFKILTETPLSGAFLSSKHGTDTMESANVVLLINSGSLSEYYDNRTLTLLTQIEKRAQNRKQLTFSLCINGSPTNLISYVYPESLKNIQPFIWKNGFLTNLRTLIQHIYGSNLNEQWLNHVWNDFFKKNNIAKILNPQTNDISINTIERTIVDIENEKMTYDLLINEGSKRMLGLENKPENVSNFSIMNNQQKSTDTKMRDVSMQTTEPTKHNGAPGGPSFS